MKKCLLDMDGVIANFNGGAIKLFGKSDPYHGDNLGSWDIASILGVAEAEFWGSFDFNFWEGLEPMPDAHQIVALLEAHFGVENICVLSSPVRTNLGACADGKVAWLHKHFPQYSRRYLFGRMKTFCASSESYLIDDYYKNVKMFRESGGYACLIPRPWSSNYFCRFRVIDHLKEHLDLWQHTDLAK